MKAIKISKYSLIVGSALFLTVFASSVLGIGKPDGVGIGASLAGTPSGLPQQAQNRLSDARLKACQARESAIKTRFERLNQLVATMVEKFDAIAGRVEEYYTTKVVPSGKTVANYDTLVADITTKKTAVQTALTKAQGDVATFSCDGEDPKGYLTSFRTNMQAVKGGLKDYRTSIKNLIVAIRSVTGEAKKASPTPVATP